MRAKRTVRKHRQRDILWQMQNGRCHWCNLPMTLMRRQDRQPLPETATFEHLDSRFSKVRGKMTGRRIVLAHSSCNQNRCKQEMEQVGIDELRRRSGRMPLPIAVNK